MDTLVPCKIDGKWHIYTLRPISETEAILLGLDKRAGKEKVETRHKTKKP